MLTTNTPVIDLGSLKYGQEFPFTYTVKNIGTSEIRISKLSVGCTSCTKASTKDSILSPGQEGTIEVVFTPGSTGLATKHISVNYGMGDGAMPALDLKFKANVHG